MPDKKRACGVTTPRPCRSTRGRIARACRMMALALGLAGCGGAVDFSTWVVSYNRTVDQAQNQIALLNVMRAGDNLPLVMSSVQVVRGNGATTTGAGVAGTGSYTSYLQPTTAYIDAVTGTLAPSTSFTVSNGFNFDVAILDTAEFEQGFLTPIRVSTLSLFLQRGIPIEVLLNLFVESATFTKADGSTRTAYNDPSSPSYDYFTGGLKAVLKLGLTTEPFPPFTPVGPVLTAADVKANLKSVVEGAKTGMLLMPAPGGFQLNMPSMLVRLCFINADPGGPDIPQNALCTNSPKRKPQGAASGSAPQKAGLQVQTDNGGSLQFSFRSTRDVFTYLGRLVQAQAETGQNPGPMLEQERSTGGKRLVPLFSVVKNQPKATDLVDVMYRDNVYGVPKDNDSYSAEVLNLLDELVKLSKSINSIPPTGTVVLH
jgi:hypothetical protein